ncbi:hypothetical protein [Streptomyces sp. NPDC015414]|uniref:hypothetical protein n=1 Tax=Streptomyces sp. NPDC015414 TaxID=3364957 RepID=UPI0036FE5CB1
MRTRYPLFVMLAAAGLAAVGPASQAVGKEAETAARSCGTLRLTSSLPEPPAGTAVQQDVSVGADCVPRFGAVRLVPVDRAGQGTTGDRRATVAGAADGSHHLSSWNEMYDCCGIRMTALYTTSDWTTDGGRVTGAATDATERHNREPWNAGWSPVSVTRGTDCTAGCADSRSEAHADFTYRGIFDATGNRYANVHHSYLDLGADGTASCRFEVVLRHTFVGWNWRHGCA